MVFIDQWYHGEVFASLQASLWPFECSVGPVTEESIGPLSRSCENSALSLPLTISPVEDPSSQGTLDSTVPIQS